MNTTTEKPVRSLTCCCCGAHAGRFQQHYNRDTGYGICPKCYAAEIKRGTSAEDSANLYGKPGVNFEAAAA